MKISVIIPTYNEEKYIGQCLDGLTNQTEKADEIIIVDNNCTDHTVDIAKKYPVRIVKENKQGMIAARNRGLNEAKYEIIARTDADTIPNPDWIKRIKKNFLVNKISALSGAIYYYDLPIPHYSSTFVFKILSFLQKRRNPLFGPNMIIRKSIWDKIKKNVCLDDRLVHEDLDLAFHIHQISGYVGFDPLLIVKMSPRRIINNPLSFFIEYPIRAIKTIRLHKR